MLAHHVFAMPQRYRDWHRTLFGLRTTRAQPRLPYQVLYDALKEGCDLHFFVQSAPYQVFMDCLRSEYLLQVVRSQNRPLDSCKNGKPSLTYSDISRPSHSMSNRRMPTPLLKLPHEPSTMQGSLCLVRFLVLSARLLAGKFVIALLCSMQPVCTENWSLHSGTWNAGAGMHQNVRQLLPMRHLCPNAALPLHLYRNLYIHCGLLLQTCICFVLNHAR